jgi:PIN domain nuclease of toxin-antitoxin system
MVVIDTHILLWWATGDPILSSRAVKRIKYTLSHSGELLISSISAWEIAMLIEKNRLVLSMDIDSWLDKVSQIDGIRFIAVDNEIAIKSTMLPGQFHKDPADRIIVATARKFAIPLITADEKILQYEHVETVY